MVDLGLVDVGEEFGLVGVIGAKDGGFEVGEKEVDLWEIFGAELASLDPDNEVLGEGFGALEGLTDLLAVRGRLADLERLGG